MADQATSCPGLGLNRFGTGIALVSATVALVVVAGLVAVGVSPALIVPTAVNDQGEVSASLSQV
jgi:hypothetical protein